ncbi:MAG: hypothetical protein HY978_00665 [Candidatus Liptonbacteria bacterium]|nr:hypothetical protein [Candidatus Liptonbacteria bacterium]
MQLSANHPDPLGVLASAGWVVENAASVFIRDQKICVGAKAVLVRIKQGFDTLAVGFGDAGNLQDNVQAIFLEDVVNFSFWSDAGSPKWRVEWPPGQFQTGGWYAMKSCFERALSEGTPLLDARYLLELEEATMAGIFRGADGTIMPLLAPRAENLREAGQALLEKFDGQFVNVLEESGYDAIKLVQLILDNFPSFRDTASLEGREIRFYKRAQVCPNDLSYLFPGQPERIRNLNQLTAFADYKLPQVLREMGVLEYSPELVRKIDAGEEIPAGSREEIEIRAATIWAVELLRQHLGEYSAGRIDNALWLIGQDIRDTARPHHRTRTIFY